MFHQERSGSAHVRKAQKSSSGAEICGKCLKGSNKVDVPPIQCIILRRDCLSSMKAIALISDYQDLQDPEELYQFVGRSEEVPGTFVCSICKEFKASRRGLVRNHVESIHFRGVFRYRCDICDKDFHNRNKKRSHEITSNNNVQLNCDLCIKTFDTSIK